MLLAIDIGNTKIKVAVFEGDAIVLKSVFEKAEAEKNIKKIFQDYPRVTNSILSSVGKEDAQLLQWLESQSDLLVINHTSTFPFINKYATPATLGVDRMVLASGAVLTYPNQSRLIIDAGTCVTYDFVDDETNYFGGAISPGLRLRYESLHNFTANLPLLYPETPKCFIGNSTKSSIHSGVVNGLLCEVEGFITRCKEQYPDLKIILTGGDAEFLAKSLKSTIFANCNFLLESLNKLYLYTIQNQK